MRSNPLQWPAGRPRTARPRFSQFKATLQEAERGVYYQLEMLGAEEVIITSNLRAGRGGIPSTRQTAEDTGIAVYFNYNGERHCMAIDRYMYFWENMRAIEKSLEAIRGLERWGGAEIVKTSLGGFKELPANAIITAPAGRAWYDILEVQPTASREVVEGAYKRLLHKVHPDKGGNDAAFMELQNAWKEYMGQKG
jgi:hypothetical protein